MIEFITKLAMLGLDGTEGTKENCVSASAAITTFAAESGLKIKKGSAEPHKDGFVYLSLEFIARATSEQHCSQKDDEILSHLVEFLLKRGYKPQQLYRGQGAYWCKPV
jgi:hypothetical protein